MYVVPIAGMFLTKNVRADCNGRLCSPFEIPPCGSTDCRCVPVVLVAGSCRYPSGAVLNAIDKHPYLCKSHVDCTKKGSGNFCGQYPNPHIEYGWCFSSESEAQDVFSKITPKDFLKNIAAAS